jgi:hypothetical protein
LFGEIVCATTVNAAGDTSSANATSDLAIVASF